MKVKSLGRQIQCIEHTTVTELQQQQINAFKKYIIGDLSEKNASCVVDYSLCHIRNEFSGSIKKQPGLLKI